METPLKLSSLDLPQGCRVKLKLIQPDIMCFSRIHCTWASTGQVIWREKSYAFIRFKSKGQLVTAMYDIDENEFVSEQYKDIRVVRVLDEVLASLK